MSTSVIGMNLNGKVKSPLACSLRGLDWLNFFVTDVQTNVGPFCDIFLAGPRVKRAKHRNGLIDPQKSNVS